MTVKSKYVPEIKFYQSPDAGVFFILRELCHRNIGAFHLTSVPIQMIQKFPHKIIASYFKDTMRRCNYMKLDQVYSLMNIWKDPVFFNEMYAQSVDTGVSLQNSNLDKETKQSFDKLSKLYKRDLWVPNLKTTQKLASVLDTEINSNDRFFSKMSEFYDYNINNLSSMGIAVIPANNSVTGGSIATHTIDPKTKNSKMILTYNYDADIIINKLFSTIVHEIGHHYYAKLGDFDIINLKPGEKELCEIIKDPNYAYLYINEAFSVAWQNMFHNYLCAVDKIKEKTNYLHSYGIGKMDHNNPAMSMVAPMMFNGSIITYLSEYIFYDMMNSYQKNKKPNRDTCAVNAVEKLYKQIPNIAEQFANTFARDSK